MAMPKVLAVSLKKAKPISAFQPVEPAQEENRADNVKIEMDEGGALCVLVCTPPRDQRRDGCADVLAHDDGHGSGVGDAAPVLVRASGIPTDADEDCKTAVSTAPALTPGIGF